MAATEIILLERVDKLGSMGDVVTVKPGYARNFLLPQRKALRATKENIAYFESQKKALEAENDKKRGEAEKLSAKIKGIKVPLIRQASESGQLYGSVNSRDIAEQIAAASGQAITRNMVMLNNNFKIIGLFDVDVMLHPEVVVPVTVNIARSEEEAKIQAETGRALLADASSDEEETAEEQADDSALEEVLEEGALEAEKEKQAEAEAKAAEEAEKEAERAAKKAEKEAKKAAEEAEEEQASDEAETSEAETA